MSDEEIARQAISELATLATAIRKHRDQRGDDRCWMDDEELYKVLPEGYTPPARDTAVEIAHCQRFIQCRQNPATEYISPERRIEELENQLSEAKGRARKAAQTLIAAIGSAGPENVEDAAERAVAVIASVKGRCAHAEELLEKQTVELTALRLAAGATLDAIDNVLNGADEHGRSKLAAAAALLAAELKKAK